MAQVRNICCECFSCKWGGTPNDVIPMRRVANVEGAGVHSFSGFLFIFHVHLKHHASWCPLDAGEELFVSYMPDFTYLTCILTLEGTQYLGHEFTGKSSRNACIPYGVPCFLFPKMNILGTPAKTIMVCNFTILQRYLFVWYVIMYTYNTYLVEVDIIGLHVYVL